MPETVHHLVVPVDPGEGGPLSRGPSRPFTDGVHVGQNVDADSEDARSERIKRLKQLKLVEVRPHPHPRARLAATVWDQVFIQLARR